MASDVRSSDMEFILDLNLVGIPNHVKLRRVELLTGLVLNHARVPYTDAC